MAGNARSDAGNRRTTVAAGAALVALATAVAVTSRSSVHAASVPGAHVGSTGAGAIEAIVLGIGVTAWIAITGLVAASLWPTTLRRRKRDPEDDREAPYRPELAPWEKLVLIGLPAVVFGGAALIVVAILRTRTSAAPRADTVVLHGGAGPAPTGFATPPHATASAHAAGSGVIIAALIAAAVILAIAAGIALVHARRRRHGASPAAAREALAQALDWSLDDLRREPDPRRAVIAAYARMERLLAARGLGRRAFETPLEYLRRVLAAAHVGPAPVAGLTDLFQEARFSPHAVAAGDRDRAVAALVAIREDLGRT
jgi:Domain of unknown function (DUF4129)